MDVLPPTRSLSPPGRAVLVYDGRCDFCCWAARWVEAHARTAVEIVSIEKLPRERWLSALSEDQVRASAHWITPEGRELHGGAAMTSALRMTSGARIAALIDRWPWARELGYAAIARTRGVWSRMVRAG